MKTIQKLLIALQDSEEDIRAEAARLLNHEPEPRAFDALVFALRNDKSKTVRFYAAGALGELKDERASDVENSADG
jgi:HEAT repeat protein